MGCLDSANLDLMTMEVKEWVWFFLGLVHQIYSQSQSQSHGWKVVNDEFYQRCLVLNPTSWCRIGRERCLLNNLIKRKVGNGDKTFFLKRFMVRCFTS